MAPLIDMDPGELEKFRNGDPAAHKKVYECLKTPLYSFIFRIVRDQTTTHDLVADTFVKLIENKARMQGHQNIKNFLYLAGRNLAIDFLRTQRARQAMSIGKTSPSPPIPSPTRFRL